MDEFALKKSHPNVERFCIHLIVLLNVLKASNPFVEENIIFQPDVFFLQAWHNYR